MDPDPNSLRSATPIPDDWPANPRLIQFFIPAPVPVALPHGSSYNFLRDEEVDWLADIPAEYLPPDSNGLNWVSFQVFREAEQRKVDLSPFARATSVYAERTGKVGPQDDGRIRELSVDLEGDSYSTVFEATTPLVSEAGDDDGVNIDLSISSAFDRCLEHLSVLYRACISVSHDVHLQLPNRLNMYPWIPWTTRDPVDPDDAGSMGLFMPNFGETSYPSRVETFSDNDMEKIKIALSRAIAGDPLAIFIDHARAATRALQVDADYASAVMSGHTAMEVFFDSILKLIAWEAKVTPAQITSWFERGLIKRLRMFYSGRLGGAWDTTNPHVVIGQWKSDSHDLRNRVVHQGYLPTEKETEAALRANHDVEEYVKSLLIDKWRSYPRTMLFVVGTPGLAKRGRWSGPIKERIEELMEEQEPWLESFSAWSDQIEFDR